jgi:hypothetical protein
MEVLAVRWLMPGKEIRLDTTCLDCGEPIRIRMRDDQILELDPAEAVCYQMSPYAKWRSGSGSFN